MAKTWQPTLATALFGILYFSMILNFYIEYATFNACKMQMSKNMTNEEFCVFFYFLISRKELAK